MSSSKPELKHTSDWLTHQWVVAGIVSASSRFIPIPFVDEIVRDQCRRLVVSRTLAAHDTKVSLDDLKPYYASGGGCLVGCASLVVRAPLKLILFPIRKVVALLTSVRGLPLEVMRTVLLARTLDRYLHDGKLVGEPIQSAKMRTAFDEAFARMDFRVIRAAMVDALSGVKGWKVSAMESAKRVAGPRNAEAEGLDASEDVEEGASKIEELFAQPETLKLFAEFDQRFDERMQA